MGPRYLLFGLWAAGIPLHEGLGNVIFLIYFNFIQNKLK